MRREEAQAGEKRRGSTTEGATTKQQRTREENEAFYAQPLNRKAIEVEIEMPNSKRAWKKYLHNPEAFVTSQDANVDSRSTEAEALEFQKAKGKEVKNFIASECFRKAQEAFPDESRIIGMRWLLTWKVGEQYPGGKKAKARAIVLGYQDPSYETRPTSSPTPSKAGDNCSSSTAHGRSSGWRRGTSAGLSCKGEATGGDLVQAGQRDLPGAGSGGEHTNAATTSSVRPGTVPLHWYQSVCKALAELGYQRLVTEPCCWIYKDEGGVIRSIIYGHVDDFVFEVTTSA